MLHVAGTAGVDNMPPGTSGFFVVSSGFGGGQLQIRALNIATVCSPFPTGQNNYLPKYDVNAPEICTSKIFESSSTFNVGIDYNGTLTGKLNTDFVSDGTTQIGMFSHVHSGSGSGSSIGVQGKATGGNFSNTFTGVKGLASGGIPSGNNNYGIFGSATGTVTTVSVPVNVGVYGEAFNATLGQNYGVWGKVAAGNGGFGDWAGYFSGDVFTTSPMYYGSDEMLKQNIEPIINCLATIQLIKPVTYRFDTTSFPSLSLPSGKQNGFVAQNIEEVLPELVKNTISPPTYDTLGNQLTASIEYKAVAYDGLLPYLVGAVQESKATIDSLKQQLNLLQTQLNSCCSAGQGFRSTDPNGNGISNQTVKLKSSESNFLGQSVPNPHSSQCSIPYRIDPSVEKAEIIFSDQIGTELSRVEIIARGTGQLTVLSSQLEDGLYAYSLIVDGKLIDTKKMMKQH